VVIKARFKTAPIKQWFVGREFNRRMKRRFDELGIEMPFPHTTLYFGEDKAGNAPMGRVFVEKNERRPAAAGKTRQRPSTIAKTDLPTGEEGGTGSETDDG
jgi:small conductance mechanosensitive channel